MRTQINLRYSNRVRLKSGVARATVKLGAEIVERSFAHNLDRGGIRRTWLRERAQALPASRRQPQPVISDAPSYRRPHPARGRGKQVWLLLPAHYAHWSRFDRSDLRHRLERER
jgi:hypothetical protein